MGKQTASLHLPRTPEQEDEAMRWASARRQFDSVAAALFEGDFLRALRVARVAARELQAMRER